MSGGLAAIPAEAITTQIRVGIKKWLRKDSLSLDNVFSKVCFLLEASNQSMHNVYA